jgi:hypothetical protein
VLTYNTSRAEGSPLCCVSLSIGFRVRFDGLSINQPSHPLQLFLVESLRSLSPYQERSIAQLSKELTGFSLAPDQPNQLMRWHSTNQLTSHTNGYHCCLSLSSVIITLTMLSFIIGSRTDHNTSTKVDATLASVAREFPHPAWGFLPPSYIE